MNREDIIRMAREAGLLTIGTADGGEAVYTWPKGITEEIERFAALVAAAEREECAKVCEPFIGVDCVIPAERIQSAIRARGEQK